MAQKKPYIITASEDVDINEIADDKLGAIIKNASVQDSATIMATAHMPKEEDVLTNNEFNLMTASLTDSEAKKLSSETGIKYVELDEEVFAIDDDLAVFEPELAEDSGDSYFENNSQFEDEIIMNDLESAATMFDANLSDQELVRLAELERQRSPEEADKIDFDLSGQLLMLGDQLDEVAEVVAKKSQLSTTAARQLITALARELQSDLRSDMSPGALEQKIERVVRGYEPAHDKASIMATDYITYGLRMIFAPYAWRYTKGLNARVAVVDTGIARQHSDLRVYGGVSFVPGVTSWNDDHGHGTHVAGTIAALANTRGVVGVAPLARLYAIKVLDRQGSGRISWILNGLTACYRAHMHIVNLSLGSLATTHDRGAYSRAYERAGLLLRRRRILAVAAAGNSGATSRPYVNNPARCPSFMAVAAVDSQGRRAPFSSYGPQVEIAAPGVGIWSTTNNGAYGQKSGTSMAAPHVSGTAALNKSRRPHETGTQIRGRINSTTRDLGTPGRDPFYGYGLVNAYRSVV